MRKVIFLLLLTPMIYAYPMHYEITFNSQQYITRVSLEHWLKVYVINDNKLYLDYTTLPNSKNYIEINKDELMNLLSYLLENFNQYEYPCDYNIQGYEIHLFYNGYEEYVDVEELINETSN